MLRPNQIRTDGSRSVVLRLTINRLSRYYSLSIPLHEKFWLKSKSRISTSLPEYYQLNSKIEKYEKRARDIIHDYFMQEKSLSFSEFANHFKNEKYLNKSFYDFVESQLEKLAHNYSEGTLKHYKGNLSKLKQFRAQLSFGDINLDFLMSYKRYMVTTLGNNNNTVLKSMTFLRTFIHQAEREGIKIENPFKNYKIGKIIGQRNPLLPGQLDALENLYYENRLPSGQQNVLKYFLFSCFTGLRYQDIKDLKFSDIQVNKDQEGNDINIVSIIQHKTKDEVRIPLSNQAVKLLPDDGLDQQQVFRVLTNQKTNSHLKSIALAARLNRRLTFHESRHTFATHSLDKGIQEKVVSELLGHKDLKTTQEYLKVRDSLKIESMKKWER